MRKEFYLIITFILLLTSVFAVQAEEKYNYYLAEEASYYDVSETWYAKLSAPQVNGMADLEKQTELNRSFAETLFDIASQYEQDVEYAQANPDGQGMPHFGYEFFFEYITNSSDYYVFDTVAYYAAGSSMTTHTFWTLDKNTGKLAELDDFVKEEDWETIHDAILAAMTSENEKNGMFWLGNNELDEALAHVAESRHWYIDQAGNLVITFDKYEIAPGAAGESRFEIVGNEAFLLQNDKHYFSIFSEDIDEGNPDNWSLNLRIPEIQGLADPEAEKALNEHFKQTAEDIRADYHKAAAEAVKSQISGNSPHFSYAYDYEILTNTENLFVFATHYTYISASLSEMIEYWTLDKNTGTLVRFDDVVSDTDMERIHDLLLAKMKEMTENGEGFFQTEDDSLRIALSQVSEKHHWFLRADGNLVIAFDKYEIAPGVMGNPAFLITQSEAIPYY